MLCTGLVLKGFAFKRVTISETGRTEKQNFHCIADIRYFDQLNENCAAEDCFLGIKCWMCIRSACYSLLSCIAFHFCHTCHTKIQFFPKTVSRNREGNKSFFFSPKEPKPFCFFTLCFIIPTATSKIVMFFVLPEERRITACERRQVHDLKVGLEPSLEPVTELVPGFRDWPFTSVCVSATVVWLRLQVLLKTF